MPAARTNLPTVGTTWGKWRQVGVVYRQHGRTGIWMVPVECSCGVRSCVPLKNLERGVSEGCVRCREHYRVDADLIPDDELRRVWRNRWCRIQSCCNNPRSVRYKNYGRRGIRCEWKNQREFFTFVRTLPGWEAVVGSDLTLDRIDNDGNYGPSNVQLVSHRANNQHTRRSVVLIVDGRPVTANLLKDQYRLKAHTCSIRAWIREGCDLAEILARDKYSGVSGVDTAECVRRAKRGPE